MKLGLLINDEYLLNKLNMLDTGRTLGVNRMYSVTEDGWKEAMVAKRLTTQKESREFHWDISHCLFSVDKHVTKKWKWGWQQLNSWCLLCWRQEQWIKLCWRLVMESDIDQCTHLFFMEIDQRLLLVADGCSGKVLGFKTVVQHTMFLSPALGHFLPATISCFLFFFLAWSAF